MNKSVIKDIFHGVRGQMETMHNTTKEYNTLLSDKYDQLIANMSPEILKYHKEFIDALESNQCDEIDFFFCEGFKLGLQIGLEVMDK